MHGFNHSCTLSASTSSPSSLWNQPRFLRAIPSLMVLTTAIAWSVSSHAGGLALDGALRNGVSVAAGSAGSGANRNITDEQRTAAMAAVSIDANAQGVGSEVSGGLKGGANAATNAASGARTGMPGTGKSGAAGARLGAGMDADAGAGLKGVIPTR